MDPEDENYDSDDDSDYVPEEDTNQKELVEDNKENELEFISTRRKRLAEELLDQMNEEDQASIKEKMSLSYLNLCPCPIPLERPTKRFRRELKEFFKEYKSFNNKNAFSNPYHIKTVEQNGEDIRLKIKENLDKIVKKTVVVETRKFAGESVEIAKTVTVAAKEAPKKNADNLDKVLEAIKGPKAISTVSKSSTDWENYKEKEGLQDALKTAAQEGFITKQEFLQRCDYRNFEQEREVRLAKINKNL